MLPQGHGAVATANNSCGSSDVCSENKNVSEARHFDDVCDALASYSADAAGELVRINKDLCRLSSDDLALLDNLQSCESRAEDIQKAVRVNQNFLDLILEARAVVEPYTHNSSAEDKTSSSSSSSSRCSPRQTSGSHVSKVRSTLRQFVRDWSCAGQQERDAAYGPLLQDLLKYVPVNNTEGDKANILCPGSGLGRLPFEVVRQGYNCQGNEFSYFMLLGSNLILNCPLQPESCEIAPYCLSLSNRSKMNDHLRLITLPDVAPGQVVPRDAKFSMCAGEFVEVYWDQEAKWDGVLTCFFIDTAKNIIQYIRTIARILKPGGLWSNFGPLLYHFSDMPEEISIELSWEEIRNILTTWFEIKEEEWCDAFYTTDTESLMQTVYHCVHFAAIRNTVPMEGKSYAVY